MARMIFVNLPVRDLAASVPFYEALGAEKNPRFSDDTAVCMMLSGEIGIMLLTHAKFSSFTAREIPDAHRVAQTLLCIPVDSREEIDRTLERLTGAGGTADVNPALDYGVMFSRSAADPDGHIWEVMWMDPSVTACPQGAAEAVPA